MRRACLVLLGSLLLTSALYGQTHDLGLEIEVIAPAVTPPGSTGRLILTVTNYGPDPAGTASPTSLVGIFGSLLSFSLDYGDLIEFDRISEPSLCALTRQTGSPLPGEPIPVAYTVDFSELSPGESATCEIAFEINPFAYLVDPSETEDGNIVSYWRVASPPGNDPNPGNDRVDITYLLVSPASDIPTLSSVGLILMAVCIVLAFLPVKSKLRANL